MNTFPISDIIDRPAEIAKAIENGPITITGKDGKPFCVLLHPDEYAVLEEVAQIARHPEVYAKAIQPAEENTPCQERTP